MKLELHIDVDLRAPRWLRRVLLLGVPVAAMAITGTVSGVPNQFVPATSIKAAEMNANFKALDDRIDALVPPGTIVAFAGPVVGQAPEGWLFCDGTAVSRATYDKLFDAIGTTAGAGDGTTTFNLPDYRGRFLRGTDLGAGRDPNALARTAMNPGGGTGDAVNTVQTHAFASHDHSGATGTMFMPSGGGASNNLNYTSPTGGTCGIFQGVETGQNCNSALDQHKHGISSQGGSETRPTNASVNYLIKL